MLLLIDNHGSSTYNLVQLLGPMVPALQVVQSDAMSVEDIAAMAPARIVISPGPGTPDRAGISLSVIRHFAGQIPILGVGLGHQAIGQALGGVIVRAGRVMYGELSRVFHDERGIFAGVPNPFQAVRYHSLLIERASLPSALQVSAKTWDDEVMGVRRLGDGDAGAPLVGLQFHPESLATEAGEQILRNFVAMSAGHGHGKHAAAVASSCHTA